MALETRALPTEFFTSALEQQTVRGMLRQLATDMAAPARQRELVEALAAFGVERLPGETPAALARRFICTALRDESYDGEGIRLVRGRVRAHVERKDLEDCADCLRDLCGLEPASAPGAPDPPSVQGVIRELLADLTAPARRQELVKVAEGRGITRAPKERYLTLAKRYIFAALLEGAADDDAGLRRVRERVQAHVGSEDLRGCAAQVGKLVGLSAKHLRAWRARVESATQVSSAL